MTPREIAELISLGLTPIVIILSACVLWVWAGRGYQSVRRGNMTELDWLVLGICISFLGKFGDNIYWGIAWHAHALGLPSTDWLFDHGVFSNSLFRQGCGIAAACCHIQAGWSGRKLLSLVGIASAIGLLYASTLLFLK